MRQRSILFVICMITIFSLGAATVDPAWYDIDFSQEEWLASNTHNLSWGGSDMYVGRVDMQRTKNYDKTTTWKAWVAAGGTWNQNVTMLITSSHEQTRLVNVNDPTKYFPCYITFPFSSANTGASGTYVIDNSPYVLPTPYIWYGGGNFTLTVPPMTGDPTGYEGTYTTFFRFRVYADYGTPDQVLLQEELMNILVYFISPTSPPPGQTVFTNILVQRYASADGIDVATLQQNQSSLNVGAVTFSSNDSRNNISYAIRMSPAENPLTGNFAFYKEDGIGNAIPYKVHAPSRTLPSATAFTLPAPAKGPADYWQDYFELAISNMNYTNVLYTAGSYQSGIKIELIIQ